jgi:hypothetical protein
MNQRGYREIKLPSTRYEPGSKEMVLSSELFKKVNEHNLQLEEDRYMVRKQRRSANKKYT